VTPGTDDLWLLPLGGCGEIGINMNLYGHDGSWLLVDCGIGFDRESTTPRIFTANSDFIADRRDQLRGLVVTHAHEDHVGAVAWHWPRLRCPVYCSRFTSEILQRKLAEAGLAGRTPVHIVEAGDRQQLGPFDIEWVDLTHSTPESQALVIRTPRGNIFHTGDWKLDRSPVVGAHFDQAGLERLGDEGILAMVCDSTNAMVEGRSTSEGELYAALLQKVSTAPKRVVVACFGSNVARLVTLARTAVAAGRYPALLGRSLENYYRAARASGLWPLAEDMAPASHLGYLPREEVFAVATGSQGEPGAALSRLAVGGHPAMELEPEDTVIFSSRVIPGNEASLERLYRQLRSRGVNVVTDVLGEAPIHASGHPARDDLRDMYRWIRPRIAVPVHGEPEHLDAHAALARDLGVPMVLNGRNGDLFRLAPQPGIRREAVATGRLDVRR
jgi:ribonuclease J